MLTLRKGALATSELVIKRSRFLTFVSRTDSAEEARQMIANIRDSYPDARHHCTAYVLKPEGLNPILHSNDDGEPPGTAGLPMLEVLKHAGVENVTAVVVRYFGGTLLGKGGLVRAYSSGVQEALENARLVTLADHHRYRLSVPLALAGKTESELRGAGWNVVDTKWGENLQIEVSADPRDVAALLDQVAAVTQSPVDYELLGTIRTQVDRPSLSP